jgi:MHS family shikimate/dehydroshikimate transporter-like MFS transporter
VPFLASVLLILVGLFIRTLVSESPAFARLQATNQTARTPVRDVIRRNWREILLGAGARLSENSVFYIFATYILTYGNQVLAIPRFTLLTSVNVAAAIACFTIPTFGLLSDYVSRKSVYFAGNVALIVLAVPYYALLATREPTAVMLATVIMLGVVHAMLYGVQAALISELFATRLRYTGASLAYQLAGPFAGGLAPIIATSLVYQFGGSYWPLAAYIALLALASIVCVHLLAETVDSDTTS